jgi:hypothetical protein
MRRRGAARKLPETRQPRRARFTDFMIRLADYVAQTLVRHDCTQVFMVTGGMAMHLNDAIGRCAGLS